MKYRFLSTAFLLTGLGLVGAAAFWFWLPARPAPRAFIPDAERELSDCVPNVPTELSFRVVNSTSHTVSIIGLGPMCGTNACFSTNQAVPFDIPAGASGIVMGEVKTNRTGPFDANMNIYVDDDGLRTLTVRASGEVRPTTTAK